MPPPPHRGRKFRRPTKYFGLNLYQKKKAPPTLPFKKIFGIFLFLFFFGTTSAAILVVSRGFLPINDVECPSANDLVPESELNTWCLFLRRETIGKSLVFLDRVSVETVVKRSFPAVLTLSLKKIWPSALRADFHKRQPLLAVYATPQASASAENEDFYWVDEEGVLFSKVEEIEKTPSFYWPQASVSGILKLGRRLDSPFGIFILEAVSKLKMAGLKITSLNQLSDNAITVSLSGGPRLQLSSRKPVGEKVTVLQMVMEKYRIEGKVLKTVDLRFQDPVVEY